MFKRPSRSVRRKERTAGVARGDMSSPTPTPAFHSPFSFSFSARASSPTSASGHAQRSPPGSSTQASSGSAARSRLTKP